MKLRTLVSSACLAMVAALVGFFAASEEGVQRTVGTMLGYSPDISSKAPGHGDAPGLDAKAEAQIKKAGWHAAMHHPEAFVSRILPQDLKDYEQVTYPVGPVINEEEQVTAYVWLTSTGNKMALMPNQNGEYPRIQTQSHEPVEVRLIFSESSPGESVAVSVQDGGILHTGKATSHMKLDESRQLALGFLVSANPGIHRISLTTQRGEVKTLNFWAGPELRTNSKLVSQLRQHSR